MSNFLAQALSLSKHFDNLEYKKGGRGVQTIHSPKGFFSDFCILVILKQPFRGHRKFFRHYHLMVGTSYVKYVTFDIKSGFPLSLRLRANGSKNSQHCCTNNVGSFCVRVGSGVQMDATTLNNVGPCSASWEGYNP